jgi:uncharacterized membrane protein
MQEERMQEFQKSTVYAAIAGLMATGAVLTTSLDAAPDKNQEKCYGIAKKGMNDCGAKGHDCSGKAMKDNDPAEWKYVPKGKCAQMGGKLMAPK